ncbi:MAG: polymerase delta prime subunit [Pseudomonadota bacterium]
MTSIIGHTKQRRELSDLVRSDRLPSALVFSGLHGIGKNLVAREVARQLLCEQRQDAPPGGCGTCRTCTLFESGTHPDLITLSFAGERGATVDDIREALEKMSLKPFMGGKKVAILNDADEISIVGANILLKSLEEPRPNTYFILVLANPSRLPATILSRCQRFFFDRLSTDEIKQIINLRGIQEISEALTLLADGSAASLDSLQAQSEMWEDVRAVVERAWAGDQAMIARAAQEWGADKNQLKERLTFLRTTIRQRLMATCADAHATAVWGVALQNALDAEYLILDRHVNPTLTIFKALQSCNGALSSRYQVTPHQYPTLGELLMDGR